MFHNQFDNLNDTLSLQSNEFLACRWNLFLDNVPECYINIRLYLDNKQMFRNPIVRRKLLNGNLYDFDNKLAPIPQLRSYSESLTKEKRKPFKLHTS